MKCIKKNDNGFLRLLTCFSSRKSKCFLVTTFSKSVDNCTESCHVKLFTMSLRKAEDLTQTLKTICKRKKCQQK